MAEAVGLAASIIAILQLSTRVVNYLRGIKEATDDRRKLQNELVNITILLDVLKERFQPQPRNQYQPQSGISMEAVTLLMVRDGPLEQLQSLLERLVSRLAPLEGFSKLRALTWPFKMQEFRDILNSIERFKTCCLLALQSDVFELYQELSGNVADLVDNVNVVRRIVSDLQETQELRYNKQQTKEILDWLSPLGFWEKQKDVFASRQAGTGTWLLEHQLFQKWAAGGFGNTLFCPGIPGAGKTVLTSIIIDHLQDKYCIASGDYGLVAVIYVYCNYKEQGQSPANLIGSLLRQLTFIYVSSTNSKSDCLPDAIVALFEQHEQIQTRPSLSEYMGVFRQLALEFARIYVILDALDECPESNIFLEKIMEIMSDVSYSENIWLLATSRLHVRNIEERFSGVPRIEIRASDPDVRTYLESQILESKPRLLTHARKRHGLMAHIVESIAQKAEGMFLLARLHLDAVASKHTVRKILETLESLPQGLNATYDNAMERILKQQEDDATLAKRVLTWITYALRPLTVEELRHAVATELHTREIDEDALPDEDLMLSVCAGLVAIDHEGGQIRLVHYTAQEYFDQNREKLFPNAHSEIAATCITYLSFDIFSQGCVIYRKQVDRRLTANPLLHYAAHNWGKHARNQLDKRTESLILEFLKQKKNVSTAVEVLQWRFHGRILYDWEIQQREKDTRGFLVAAHFGLDQIFLQQIALAGTDITATNSLNQTALLIAARNGHEGIVQLLLERQEFTLMIDAKDIDGRTALSHAAKAGHCDIIKLLLKQEEVHVDSQDNAGRTPLTWAAGYGQVGAVKLILSQKTEKRVNPDCKDKGGRTPLSWAARNGHAPIVKLLLAQEEVQCDCGDNDGRTPLSWAAGDGHEEVVRLLLAEDNVDPDLKDSRYGRTPLARAAENGHESVVGLLLARNDVDPNSTDLYRQTPLSLATRYQREAVIHLLLARDDVEPQWRAKGGQTALSWAARRGHEGIVKLLLQRKGINPMSRDGYGRTALSWAMSNGHNGVVRLLTEWEEDISNGNTAQ